jgi:IgA Peptidase M64
MTSDGSVGEAIPVVNNGDPRRKWNLVVLGDGYQPDELVDFRRAVDGFCTTLRATPPFGAMWSAINVYRIDVISPESGADDPRECGGKGKNPTTFFDATFCSPWGGQRLDRLLTVDSRRAKDIAKDRLPQTHQVLVIVNATKYGGSGGGVAVCSMAPEAFNVAIHEIGHSAFHLADEYDDDPGVPAPRGEPVQPNITISDSRENPKWDDLIQGTTPVPSSRNAGCRGAATIAGVPQDAVGVFEGAGHSRCGVFRPADRCRMRATNDLFCPVCARVIQRTLAVFRRAPARVEPIEPGIELVFDPIATQIEHQEVVSFLCYVSKPLSQKDRYCLVYDSWWEGWVLVHKDDVVASVPGITRADGKSVVWVKRGAEVVRKNGQTTTAYDVALDLAETEAKLWSGNPDPPPYKHPK